MKPNITIKIFYKDGTHSTYQTRKIKRIYYQIQRAEIQEAYKYVLRINYGIDLNNKNKKIMFINEGEYKNSQDLKHAIKCFTE